MGDYVVEQRIEKDGIYMRVAGGKETFLSYEEIKKAHDAEVAKGTLDPKAATTDALQQKIIAAFGDLYDASIHSYDYDDKTGAITTAETVAPKAVVP